MIKHAFIVVAIALFIGCNSGPSQTADNAVGGPNIVATAQTPMTKDTTTLSLDWGKKAQAGQVAIADVLSYGGSKITITAPEGWQKIRDDSTPTTRQSLYWHAIEANDPSTATWTFGAPVNAQGAIVLLDNVASAAPVDMTSGNTGAGGTVTAMSTATTSDGDLILSFFATDFGLAGLMGNFQDMPPNTRAVVNQQGAPFEYWILASYMSQNGASEEQVSSVSQIFNWATAQVAIKKGAGTP
jgi:hypothetical protein